MSTTEILLVAAILLGIVAVILIAWGLRRSPPKPIAKPSEAIVAPSPAATVETPPAPAPMAPFAPTFLPAPEGEPDDLSRIKGIGPKLSTRLSELGVFHYRQIADWTPEQMAEVDSQLGNFAGRPERDQWQSQARLLAEGDVKAYERVHGKLGPTA